MCRSLSKKNRPKRKRRKRKSQRPSQNRKKRKPKRRREKKKKRRRRKSRRKNGVGSERSNSGYNSTTRHFIFPSLISSQATLAGEPWFGRVTQPGFRNKTPRRFSFRGTCV